MVTTGLAIVGRRDHHRRPTSRSPTIVRETINGIGYDRESFGFDGNTCGVMTSIDQQSPDIAQGVDTAYETPHRRVRRGRPQQPGRRRPGDDVRLRRATRPTTSCRCRSGWRTAWPTGWPRSARPASCRTCGPTGRPRSPSTTRTASRSRSKTVLISTQHQPGLDAETLIKPDLDRARHPPADPAGSSPDDDLRGAASTRPARFELGGPHADCRPHRPQDHRRHLRRHGPPRRRRLLGQGPVQGRPLGRLRRPLGGQERGRRRRRPALRGPGGLRHRRGPPGVDAGRDVRHRDRRPGQDRRGRRARSSTCARPPSSATSTCAGRSTRRPPPTATSAATTRSFTWEQTTRVDDLKSALGSEPRRTGSTPAVVRVLPDEPGHRQDLRLPGPRRARGPGARRRPWCASTCTAGGSGAGSSTVGVDPPAGVDAAAAGQGGRAGARRPSSSTWPAGRRGAGRAGRRRSCARRRPSAAVAGLPPPAPGARPVAGGTGDAVDRLAADALGQARAGGAAAARGRPRRRGAGGRRGRGHALVLCPSAAVARRGRRRPAARRRRAWPRHPRDWAPGAAGRRPWSAPGPRPGRRCRDLAAVVVLDEHDEAHQEERRPRGTPATSPLERARRAACRACWCRRARRSRPWPWGRLLTPSPRRRAGRAGRSSRSSTGAARTRRTGPAAAGAGRRCCASDRPGGVRPQPHRPGPAAGLRGVRRAGPLRAVRRRRGPARRRPSCAAPAAAPTGPVVCVACGAAPAARRCAWA